MNCSVASDGKEPSDDDVIPDPLTAMWEFMEVGVVAMGEALGIAPTQCSPTKAEVKAEPVTLARYATEQNAAAMETMKRSSTRTTPDVEKEADGRVSPVQSTMEYASHLLVGPNGEVSAQLFSLKSASNDYLTIVYSSL
jgi:glucose/arabinose dehydrogenase